MPFKPVQPPSAEYTPISKDLARFMVGKGSAKVIAYSKLRWTKEKGTSLAVKEQDIDDRQELDELPLYSRHFDTLTPNKDGKLTTLRLTSEYSDSQPMVLEYDPDLDVFFEKNEGKGDYIGVPYFVETPKDYKPSDGNGTATIHYIPVTFDWGLRDPDASEVLSQLKKIPQWKDVQKFDVVNVNPGANDNTVSDGAQGIYVWNGTKLLELSDANDTTWSPGVVPISIRAIIDVPIGYYDRALKKEGSVDWFDMKSVLPKQVAKPTQADIDERDLKIDPHRNVVLVPGCIGDDQGGLLQVYSFIFKNQKFRVVAYTSAQADPSDLQDQFLNYMDYFTQYQSKTMFMRRLNDLVGSSRGVDAPGELANIPTTLRDLLNKFDESRTLFLPLSWRNIENSDVDASDAKVLDFLKEDDTDSKKSRNSSSENLQSLSGRFARLFETLI